MEQNNKNKQSYFDEHPTKSILIISALISLWFLVIPAIVGLIMLFLFIKRYKETKEDLNKKSEAIKQAEKRFSEENFMILREKVEKEENKLKKQSEKLEKLSYVYNSVKSYLDAFDNSQPTKAEIQKIEKMISGIEAVDLMNPTTQIALHCTEMRDLKKRFRDVNKDIDAVLADYESRYTTKGNLAIYRLMVVALRSELQNVLYTMKFGKLSDAEDAIGKICDKYIMIAADGNKAIAPTITKFVTQTKSLFIDAARIEYEYHLRKERAKEEQRALREKMREEAEERKRLEAERKKIEAEESKYTNEMKSVYEQLSVANGEKAAQLQARIAELENMMNQVAEKRETILKLQNGKAGYVYVISNLGSFGDHVFKIGMTRRMEWQDRIDELSSASVPFSFDVHSVIFSDDAVSLETDIHHRLNDRRVNKINHRKEFFDISLDELEALVYEIQPAADFTRTMAAEQYRQSLSMVGTFSDFEDEEDEEDE